MLECCTLQPSQEILFEAPFLPQRAGQLRSRTIGDYHPHPLPRLATWVPLPLSDFYLEKVTLQLPLL